MNAIMISPPVSNGLSWLVNCLLELDVLCFLGSVENMWTRKTSGAPGGTAHELKADHDWLRIHLPALSRKEKFTFSSGATVQWGHSFPKSDRVYDKVILFARDPRDAIYSMFLRGGVRCGYDEYLETIQNHTLLPLLDDWIFFHHCWLSRGDIHIVRFEDYKANAVKTLKDALAYLGLFFPDAAIAQAAALSTHRKAREAEEAYRAGLPNGPGARPFTNRKSAINDYASHEDGAAAAAEIYRRTSGILAKLGYDAPGDHAVSKIADYLPYVLLNNFFASLPGTITAQASSPLFSNPTAIRLADSLIRHIESGGYLKANKIAIYKRDTKDLVDAILAVFDNILKQDIPEPLKSSILRVKQPHP